MKIRRQAHKFVAAFAKMYIRDWDKSDKLYSDGNGHHAENSAKSELAAAVMVATPGTRPGYNDKNEREKKIL